MYYKQQKRLAQLQSPPTLLKTKMKSGKWICRIYQGLQATRHNKRTVSYWFFFIWSVYFRDPQKKLCHVVSPLKHEYAWDLKYSLQILNSVSDPYSLNPDPAKNLNSDQDPERPWIRIRIQLFLYTIWKKLKLHHYYKFLSLKEVN